MSFTGQKDLAFHYSAIFGFLRQMKDYEVVLIMKIEPMYLMF